MSVIVPGDVVYLRATGAGPFVAAWASTPSQFLENENGKQVAAHPLVQLVGVDGKDAVLPFDNMTSWPGGYTRPGLVTKRRSECVGAPPAPPAPPTWWERLKAERPALVLCFYGLLACCVASVFVAVFS